MKSNIYISLLFVIVFSLNSCKQQETISDMNIIFLHHSTGNVIWKGTSKGKKADLNLLFNDYNKEFNKNYLIKEKEFPKASPYGWKNYPFDYYNIWVKNAGDKPFMEEPTLEILTKDYEVIIFKHCFPVSNIQADNNTGDINSETKTISNYKLQYNSLRDKLHQFSDTKFILFTGAVQVQSTLSEDEAKRMKEFYDWVINEWDLPEDNIYLWDLYILQTEGGLYFKDESAVSKHDSHPNAKFAGRIVKLLFNRIIDVIENDGRGTQITGETI